MSECWTACCCHCLWYGYQQCKATKLLGSTGGQPFFQSQNQATATIYDPPQLLKCTHDQFLKYNVQFESEHLDSHLPVIVKWEHTEIIYKQETHFRICRMFKLTDTNLAPVTQCAMIVILAAQVMSHTLAAAIFSLVSYGKEQCLHSFCFCKK